MSRRTEKPRLPARYAPFVYGIIQAAITTAVATAIATNRQVGLGLVFLQEWSTTWVVAWLTMLPVVVFIAPFIQKVVMSMTEVRPER